jgi:acyl carrier protein
MPLSEADLVNNVIVWVGAHKVAGVPDNIPITPDTDLINTGILDSMGLVDLIVYIIGLGFNVDLTSLDPSEFSVVKELCRTALRSLQ